MGKVENTKLSSSMINGRPLIGPTGKYAPQCTEKQAKIVHRLMTHGVASACCRNEASRIIKEKRVNASPPNVPGHLGASRINLKFSLSLIRFTGGKVGLMT